MLGHVVNHKRGAASVVDLFCGAGGLAHGFRLEGFQIAAGVDIEAACRYPFERNNNSTFHQVDVTQLTATGLDAMFLPGSLRVLVGCAPCQPFSTYNQKRNDPQWSLVDKFAELIAEAKPDIISMENVPRLADYHDGKLFKRFERKLETAGYKLSKQIAYLPDYGLPQRRTRLVVLGSLHGKIELEQPKFSPENYRTVADTIGEMPIIAAGERWHGDPLHSASRLSPLNLRRLQSSRPGGTWRDWDSSLVAPCHRDSKGKGYGAVYGRMSAREPSPTITTQFYNFGSGRFGHPEQDRALSLREGAMLQSFPRSYEFIEPGRRINVREVGKLIGNAVPVELGRAIARSVRGHIERAGLVHP